jgi:hypothetical protein
MRLERKRLAPLALGLVLYVTWVYVLSPARLSAATPDLVLGLTRFDARYDPWLIWVHNIYGLYGIPLAVMLLLDDQEQSMPGWLFALLSVMVLGIWPLFLWYAVRQPRGLASVPRSRWVRFLESPVPALYTAGFSVYLTHAAVTRGDLSVLARYAVDDLYVHGCLLDLVAIWAFAPVAIGVDMEKRGMRSPWIRWGLGLLWLVGPIVYMLVRRPLPDRAPRPAAAPA